LSLTVVFQPQGRIRLESCLEYFTKIEIIDDAYCDACTLRLTLAYYTSEAQRLALPSGDPPAPPSASKKKRAREARKIEKILKGLLDDNAVAGMETAPGLEEVKWVKGRSRSAKQAMIARVRRIHMVKIFVHAHLYFAYSHHQSFAST
jgi:ubiquitin carboxyl-terminal hydrolase 1